MWVVTEAIAFGPFTIRQAKLLYTHFCIRVFLVVARLFGQVVGCIGDGHITCGFMPIHLRFGLGQVSEESRDTFILRWSVALQCKQRGTTNKGMGWVFGDRFPVRQVGRTEIEFHAVT
ncbi:Uncharacterised protein [Vibrio cholerae]|uniref:Uncharacterized protein n=1 Tax=Vibrio cholerae TaxID=666 RepID=A0A655QPE4_VIBCL|nr:Uncharacterised protein [Vibrio cholerae]